MAKSRGKIYYSWFNMKQRCLNPHCNDYSNYGGKGIKVCKRWLDFSNFNRDMLSSYKDGLSLDRMNNKGYSKENCRWATAKQQAENRTNTHLFSYKGISNTLTNWANILGIKRSTLAQRFYVYRWSIERTLSERVGI